MRITIDDSVLNNYPETVIAYLIAKVKVEVQHPYVETLKVGLQNRLDSIGINQVNLLEHPNINGWRQIYNDEFGVKPNKFRSSIEALVRRVISGQGLWQISSLVDLYNCVSVLTLLPIGGYNLKKIKGDISLRYGYVDEFFLPLGSQEVTPISNKHIVYADEEKILCHLWNYKDSRLSAIDNNTQDALFFIDAAFHTQAGLIEEALQTLSYNLTQIGSMILTCGQLDINCSSVEL